MPWFKVDDGFYSSKKVLSIPRTQRLAAVGLWTMAGNWSGRELSDGVVPAYVLDELGATPKLRQALVKARLWLDHPEGGIEFRNWVEYQPTRDQVEEDRKNSKERQRRHREKVRDSPVSDALVTRDSRVSHSTPTRPDPTRPINTKDSVHPTDELKSEFASFWTLYPRKQGKADAFKAFTVARKKTPAKTIIDGAQAYALLNIGEDKSFLKLPGGWIRGERWDDELIVNATKHTTTEQPAECPIHPGYPMPCEACKREQLEGRAF